MPCPPCRTRGPTAAITKSRSRDAGFTLIEVAVVVVALALLLGTILVPLVQRIDERRVAETERMQDEILEALIGYALRAQPSPYLPCPDKTAAGGAGTANDGVEDVEANGRCTVSEGNLPWATLGTGAVDAWGNRFRYVVDAAYTEHPHPGIGSPVLTSTAGTDDLQVCARQNCQNPPVGPTTLARRVPAIVISHGKNGYGAITRSGTQLSTTGAGNDELENAGGFNPNRFVSRARTSAVAGGAEEFDDVVTWLSPHVLIGRLIAGGRLQ